LNERRCQNADVPPVQTLEELIGVYCPTCPYAQQAQAPPVAASVPLQPVDVDKSAPPAQQGLPAPQIDVGSEQLGAQPVGQAPMPAGYEGGAPPPIAPEGESLLPDPASIQLPGLPEPEPMEARYTEPPQPGYPDGAIYLIGGHPPPAPAGVVFGCKGCKAQLIVVGPEGTQPQGCCPSCGLDFNTPKQAPVQMPDHFVPSLPEQNAAENSPPAPMQTPVISQPQPAPEQQVGFQPPITTPATIEQPLQAQGTEVGIPMAALAAMIDEQGENLDMDAILATVPGLGGGPSEGGISWHTLEPFKLCRRRAYLEKVRGIRRNAPRPALDFGSLFHAIMYMHRASGGQRTYEPCQAVSDAGGAALSGDVWRLAHCFLTKYATQESQTWAYRALEHNAVMWMPSVKIGKKQVRIPLSCRHDTVVHLKHPQEGWPPAGPLAGGVWIEDLKTAGRKSYELTKAFGMDSQFMMNALVFLNSGEVEMWGPLQGVIVSIAFKHKQPTPDASCQRLEVPLKVGDLIGFYEEDIKPWVVPFYELLAREDRMDEKLWPRNRALGTCRGPYGLCQYFDLCDQGLQLLDNTQEYLYVERQILTLDKLWPPPPEVKERKGIPIEQRPEEQAKADAASNKRKLAADARKQRALEALLALVNAFVQLNLPPAEDGSVTGKLFDPAQWLVPNHTEASVKDALELYLTTRLYKQGSNFNLGEFAYVVSAKGFQWKRGKNKGTVTYKNVAAELCKNWWDASTLDPTPVQE
jgi:hypothetical protein